MLDFLNPSSVNFFGIKLVEGIGDLLKNLFVPSQEKILAINNIFSQKFSFVETIKTLARSIQNMYENVNAVPSMTIDIPNNRTGITQLTVIDLSWYTPFKPYGDLVVTAFSYLFFIWRLFARIPSILHGLSTLDEHSSNTNKPLL